MYIGNEKLSGELSCNLIVRIRVQKYSTKYQYKLMNNLTCMDVGVFFHIRFLVEPFATILARIWPRIAVDQQMGGQCAGSFECFAALLTLKLKFERK